MRQNKILMCVLVLLSINSFCQDKGTIGISIGRSIPNGNFALTDFDDEKSGFAKTGTIYDLSMACIIKDSWGVAGLIRLRYNPFNIDMLKNELRADYPGVYFSVTGSSWITKDFLAGFYGSSSLSDKYELGFKLLGGCVFVKSPEYLIVGGGNDRWVKTESSTTFAYGVLIGAGIKYKATEKICIFANIDYLGSEFDFKDVLITNDLAQESKSDYTQPFGVINFAFGIGYRFK